MTKTITKQHMRQAAINEDLKPGKWVHLEHDMNLNDCPVCAVGGVLRQASFTSGLSRSYQFARIVEKIMMWSPHPYSDLVQLSDFYECYASRLVTDAEIREALLCFIEQFMPDEIEVTL